MEENKESVIFCRVEPSVKEKIREAAKEANQSISSYCINAAMDRAMGFEEERMRAFLKDFYDYTMSLMEDLPGLKGREALAMCFDHYLVSPDKIKRIVEYWQWEHSREWKRMYQGGGR